MSTAFEPARQAGDLAVQVRIAVTAVTGGGKVVYPLEAVVDGSGKSHLLGRGHVAERKTRTHLVDDGADLAATQKRHGGDAYAARLGDREPAGDQHGRVRPAQQNPVAGHEAAGVAQEARDPVDPPSQFRIGPHPAVEWSAGRSPNPRSIAPPISSSAQFSLSP